MRSPNHPIWSILNLAVILTFVTLFAGMNASKFDSTEIKMIVEFVAVMGGWEFVKKKLQSGGD